MAEDSDPWVTTPRQYRPTYSYLPTSKSRSNFGSPIKHTTTQPAPAYQRRRTTSTFPAVDHLHSAPTVASSVLTASVLSRDISHPSPKHHRLSLQSRLQTPIYIPTPTHGVKASAQSRAVNSPAETPRPKENVLPTSHRLLGPIPPGPVHTTGLTRSRTMNVISSLTSTFSRSSQNLVSSRASFGNLSSHTIAATGPLFLPLPPFTTNIDQVNCNMPTSYWLGRFQAMHDRLRAANLDPAYLDSPTLRQWYTTAADQSPAPAETGDLSGGEKELLLKVFTHLEALCTNHDARKSFKAFQQAYARKIKCEALLPIGGCMVDRDSGLIAKAGRLFSNGRTSFGVARRRSSLALGLDDGYVVI